MGLTWPANAIVTAFALLSSVLAYANHRIQLEHMPCDGEYSSAGVGELEESHFLPDNRRLAIACNALYNRSTVI